MKSIASGTLTSGNDNLFIVPALSEVKFTSLYIFNPSPITRTFTIVTNRLGNKSQVIAIGSLDSGESCECFDTEIGLEATERLSGFCDVGSVLTWVLFGEIKALT